MVRPSTPGGGDRGGGHGLSSPSRWPPPSASVSASGRSGNDRRVQPPPSHTDLLERPLFAHVATVRPDGTPQTNPMWYEWDGERIRLTHTKTRQKFRNLVHEPRLSLSITDPDDPYRFLEVRGLVERVEDDADASFYRSLQRRYERVHDVTDASVRVVITVRPQRYIAEAATTSRR